MHAWNPFCQNITCWTGIMQMHSEGFVMVSNRLSPEMMLEDGIESCNAVSVLQAE